VSTFPAKRSVDAVSALSPSNNLRIWADVAVASKLFKDSADVARALIKIKTGAEFGLPEMASMMGVYITTDGKVGLHATLMGGLIQAFPWTGPDGRRANRFKFRTPILDPKGCTIEFFERDPLSGEWESCGVPVSFTMQDATVAGLLRNAVWRQYPRPMLYARALSMGARLYCSVVFNGRPVYVPEEIGAAVGPEGEVLEIPAPPPGYRTSAVDPAGQDTGVTTGNSPDNYKATSGAITDPATVAAEYATIDPLRDYSVAWVIERLTALYGEQGFHRANVFFGTRFTTADNYQDVFDVLHKTKEADWRIWSAGCDLLADQEG